MSNIFFAFFYLRGCAAVVCFYNEEWEPRVKILDIQTDYETDPKVLFMNIVYKVLSTNSMENFVYALNREIKEVS